VCSFTLTAFYGGPNSPNGSDYLFDQFVAPLC
jgi:hypothetical protein